METLAIELSKLLNITVEKAIELMPVIKEQYIRYAVLNKVGALSLLFLIPSMVTSFVLTGVWISRDEPEDTPEEENRWKRIVWAINTLTVILFIIQFLTGILQVTLSPDFMIIREFLIK